MPAPPGPGTSGLHCPPLTGSVWHGPMNVAALHAACLRIEHSAAKPIEKQPLHRQVAHRWTRTTCLDVMRYPCGQSLTPVRPYTRPRLGHVWKPLVTRVGKAGLHLETGGVGVAVGVEAHHHQWAVAEVLEQLHEPLVLAHRVVDNMLVLVALDDDAVGGEVDERVRTAPAAAPAAAHALVVDDGDAIVPCSDLLDDLHDVLLLDLVPTRHLLTREQVHKAAHAKATVLVLDNGVTTLLLAPPAHDVDHVVQFVPSTVSRGTVGKTKSGPCLAPARVLAALVQDVDHVLQPVRHTARRGPVGKSIAGVLEAPARVLAPPAHDVEHVLQLVRRTVSRWAVRKSIAWVFEAPVGVLATLVPDIHHVVQLVRSTVSRGAVRKTIAGLFQAPARVLAILAHNVCHVLHLVRRTASRASARKTKRGFCTASARVLATPFHNIDHVVQPVPRTASRTSAGKSIAGVLEAPARVLAQFAHGEPSHLQVHSDPWA